MSKYQSGIRSRKTTRATTKEIDDLLLVVQRTMMIPRKQMLMMNTKKVARQNAETRTIDSGTVHNLLMHDLKEYAIKYFPSSEYYG